MTSKVTERSRSTRRYNSLYSSECLFLAGWCSWGQKTRQLMPGDVGVTVAETRLNIAVNEAPGKSPSETHVFVQSRLKQQRPQSSALKQKQNKYIYLKSNSKIIKVPFLPKLSIEIGLSLPFPQFKYHPFRKSQIAIWKIHFSLFSDLCNLLPNFLLKLFKMPTNLAAQMAVGR